jgi:hypothetical protein
MFVKAQIESQCQTSVSIILFQIVNWTDLSWWQARKVDSSERPGLIPSQDLEERRQCFFVKSANNGFGKQVSCCGTAVSINTFYLLSSKFNLT